MKATSYATALAAVAEAEARGADDALFLGEGETLLEATMSNIWWRDGDVLTTPALSTGVLPGVTRATVARLARGRRLPRARGLVHVAGAPEAPTRRSRAPPSAS